MSAQQFIDATKRDAKIIDALHIARYALVTNNGLTCQCEGDEFPMDFAAEIAAVSEVMVMLGVDLSEPLPAPVMRRDES
jgi:hypothetical protein